jgi:hypothetical protein
MDNSLVPKKGKKTENQKKNKGQNEDSLLAHLVIGA